MKNTIVLCTLLATINLTAFSQLEKTVNISVSEDTSITSRANYIFKFKDIPPKKHLGLTRFKYEYSTSEKVYFGYYS